ncbi:DUF3995 domain-containing protein [Maribacter algarum]|uniref:DUF3995 domain-containing protein n=1 Tax=Maribacter algarum (ex Zhang et al. 2020) TaxID=2578118 RepID=A0A5S3PUR3_9FLAO|nr:DUF3995 domain-containing protein [Maribacter algarum]TMM58703.1 DUF3995 domain-containing protein [Maribacter algarum]
MVFVLGATLAVIFLFLSAIHFYWAFGGKWGIDAAIPTNDESIQALKPPIIATIIVGIGLLFFSLFYMIRIEVFTAKLPSWLPLYAGWILPSIFLLRVIGDFKYVGLLKKIKMTKFAKSDTKYFIPLCAFLALAGFIVQMY